MNSFIGMFCQILTLRLITEIPFPNPTPSFGQSIRISGKYPTNVRTTKVTSMYTHLQTSICPNLFLWPRLFGISLSFSQKTVLLSFLFSPRWKRDTESVVPSRVRKARSPGWHHGFHDGHADGFDIGYHQGAAHAAIRWEKLQLSRIYSNQVRIAAAKRNMQQ